MYKTIADAFEDLARAQELLLDETRGDLQSPKDAEESWRNVQVFLGTVLSSRPPSPLFSFSPQDIVLARKVYKGDLKGCRNEVTRVKSLVDAKIQRRKLPKDFAPVVNEFLGKVVDTFMHEKDLDRYRRYTA